MKPELERELIKNYPKIFAGVDLPVDDSPMYFGFQCGDGWYTLIDSLCHQLQFDVDKNNYPQTVATQVKEKYGTLSFLYFINIDDKTKESDMGAIDGIVQFAEFLSSSICEVCGKPGKLDGEGWLKTLCKECREYERACYSFY